jgi:hypothetical protein
LFVVVMFCLVVQSGHPAPPLFQFSYVGRDKKRRNRDMDCEAVCINFTFHGWRVDDHFNSGLGLRNLISQTHSLTRTYARAYTRTQRTKEQRT